MINTNDDQKYWDLNTWRYRPNPKTNLANPDFYHNFNYIYNFTKVKKVPLVITGFNGYNLDPKMDPFDISYKG